ncbi:Inner membrane protein yhjX [uncultured Roseburia sp.]|uniref:MFS transporter n=1 Tax=Brotonthovivens ammoniilytica TaxID=2981725 RepID=A0ABT2TMW2_9FIRM|nr:MFS transporter [Brotonthovivens ammoniilytica]MCU6763437.1 MFS transporter [Brotonthovivens ammoniilytica]SCJ19203.1 Inner membrane protein yhjX [uncultured Roseburia sp.]
MNKTSVRNFGSKGWLLILFGIICLFCNNAGTSDGLNVALPAISEGSGLDYNICLSIGTIAGFAGVVAMFVIGKIRDKIGSSKMSGILMIIFGFAFLFLFLRAENLVMYAVSMCIMVSCGQGTFFLCMGALQSSWFPKKRGVVVGISTIGANIASAIMVPIMTVLVTIANYKIGLSVFGVLPILMGILCLVFLKDNPMDAGIYPDNVSREEYERDYAIIKDEGSSYVSDWTIGKLLRTKELYLSALVPGIMGLVLVGIVSQFVNRNIALGLSQPVAVGAMTAAAVCGMFGSWLVGVLDTKMGTKKSAMLYCGFFAVGVLLNLLAEWCPPLVYVSILVIGMSLGGTTNFQISWPASIFGTMDYPFVNKLAFPMGYCIVSLNFIVNAVVLQLTGSLSRAYLVYVVLLVIDILIIKCTDAAKWDKIVHPELLKK